MKTYELAKNFCRKYPCGVYWWRVKKHSEIVEKHLNPEEEVKYAFVGQKNNSFYDFFSTSVVAITNKRILIGRKRLFFGYFLSSITPDLFNDLSVYSGIIWGKVQIDTVKEEVFLTNLDKRALADIETNVTEFMMEEKKKYQNTDNK